MALWLELIPRLHKSDNLDARYHQLDDHANLSTFEDPPYTRVTNYAAMLWQDESPPTVNSAPLSSVSAAADDNEAAAFPVTYHPFPRSRLPTLARRPQNRSATSSSVLLPQPKVVLQTSTRRAEAGSDYSKSNNTLSLGVTVGVGCALFSLNLLIFAVLYYQRDRMRRQMRLHCPGGELSLLEQKDQELIARHEQMTTTTTYRLQRCSSPPTAGGNDVDSNGDLLLPPSISSSSNRNSLGVVAPFLQNDASSRVQKRKRTSSSIPVAVPETPPPRHSSTAAVASSPAAAAAVTPNHVECRTAKYVPLYEQYSDENATDSVVDTSTSV